MTGGPVLGSAQAVEPAGGVAGWGLNSSGQLGDGTTTTRRLPVPLARFGPTTTLAAGDAFSLALGSDGVVRAAGNNAYGQLGDGTVTGRRTPVAVSGLRDVAALAAGQHHAAAVRRDGSLVTWGRNSYAQLGDGTTTSRRVPTAVPGLTGVTAVAAGDTHTLAVRADGSVWSWGSNAMGQLGDGTTTTRRSPVRVPGLGDVLAVAAGASDSLALRADGTVWAWGTNAYGQLGDGTVTARYAPVQVLGLSGVTALAAGDHFALAQLGDGTVRGWGRNSSGQLGDGTITTRRTPVPVAGLSGVLRLTAGDTHAVATLASGEVRAWGLNSSGQLGDGTTTSRRTPVTLRNVAARGPMAAGTSFTITAGPPPKVGPQPNGWWQGDDATDSGGDTPLVLTGGVTHGEGAVGCAFLVPEGGSLSAADAAGLEPGTSFTFSTWLSPQAVEGSRLVAAKSDGARTAWSLQVVDGRLRLTTSPDGAAQRTTTTSAAVVGADRWQHVTVTYDGALTEAQRVRLHVDGAPVATDPFPALAGPPASVVDLTTPTRFGGAGWQGGLDELRVYPDALTAVEVTEAYAADAAQRERSCDDVAPVTTGTLSEPAGETGWHTAPVELALEAGDGAGSGVETLVYSVERGDEVVDAVADGSSVVVPVTADGTTTVTAYATDLAGNAETPREFVVRLDTTAPQVAARRTGAAGWSTEPVHVVFSCTDTGSGVASCPVPQTVAEDGADQSVTGRATDTAGNAATATVGDLDVDTTPPVLVGRAVDLDEALQEGWARDDVTVRWAAEDATSGIDEATRPGPSVLTGEGRGLVATATVQDRAGHRATASSVPVSIDRTPPVTAVTAPEGWSRGPVELVLEAQDALSGVERTQWSLDGGPVQTGTAVRVEGDGAHALRWWSTDVAGNREEPAEAVVRVDAQAPGITSRLSEPANEHGWHRAPVTVSFDCEDGSSGVATCTAPVEVADEAASRQVEGEAVDVAGNRATGTATVQLDRTAPVVQASAPAPQASGWHTVPVEVRFTCADALSGVLTCPQPVAVGEGADRSAAGTARDAAGLAGEARLAGLSVDLGDPVLTGSADAAGWSRGDVRVAWTCSDAVSGVAGPCPDDTVVGGEGVLSAAATVTDRAGRSTTTVVEGVRIDRTTPVTLAELPEPAAGGWHTGGTTVRLAATDALSGVASTSYALDGGEPTAYTGPVEVTGDGVHELTWWSTDVAGNVEAVRTLVVQVDATAPTVTGSASPAPADGGWSGTAVTVTFSCADAGSGTATCTPPVVVDAEGADQVVEGAAVDVAGNRATTSVTVSVDRTAPEVTAVAAGTRSASGWWTTPVRVAFTCADALSGVADCPAAVTLTDGAGQQAQGTATDRAGNLAAAGVSGVDVDTVAPRLSLLGPADGDRFVVGTPTPAVSCTAEDDGSGLAGDCTVRVAGPAGGGAGTWTATATATDRAGHTATASTRWTVAADLAWSGPLAARTPLEVKAGSTLPVAFSLTDAAGRPVAGGATWLEPVPAGTALGGTGTPISRSGDRYRYGWQTPKGQTGTWQIGVRLDDGTVHAVRVVLR